MPASAASTLSDLAAGCDVCSLQPRAFFPAWSGVLTLAFHGFPPPIVELKRELGARCASLPAERPGSAWPKSTLGALRDGVVLTEAQCRRLLVLCAEESAAHFADATAAVVVSALSVVLFGCRSLEKIEFEHAIPLRSVACTPNGTSGVSPDELQRVTSTLAEAEAADYWSEGMSRPGCREAHYRGDAGGATLVARLHLGDANNALAAKIAAFRGALGHRVRQAPRRGESFSGLNPSSRLMFVPSQALWTLRCPAATRGSPTRRCT